jgi:hypothetical protein
MEPSELNWRKASYSGTNGGGCVEVTDSTPGVVAVRDSKDPGGPSLTLAPATWHEFIAEVKAGQHDLA